MNGTVACLNVQLNGFLFLSDNKQQWDLHEL